MTARSDDLLLQLVGIPLRHAGESTQRAEIPSAEYGVQSTEQAAGPLDGWAVRDLAGIQVAYQESWEQVRKVARCTAVCTASV